MTTHPEDKRLAATSPLAVTLYTRPGCHLCEDAKTTIEPLLQEFGARLREVNIDEDRELTDRYGWDIPVLFVGTRKVAKHRVNLERFRRSLQEARQNSQKDN
jgi:glutaredoxin